MERKRRNSNDGGSGMIELTEEEAMQIATVLANTVGADAARAFVFLEQKVIEAKEKK